MCVCVSTYHPRRSRSRRRRRRSVICEHEHRDDDHGGEQCDVGRQGRVERCGSPTTRRVGDDDDGEDDDYGEDGSDDAFVRGCVRVERRELRVVVLAA